MLKMQNKILFFILFIGLSNFISAQSKHENWVKVDSLESESIYVNIQGLDQFKDDDIYFWTLEDNDPPLVIESVDSKIYKTKTYYLVNKKLKKIQLNGSYLL